jgi:UDP-N-acetylglucosamine:LPS N-acetylglucosamine transferase
MLEGHGGAVVLLEENSSGQILYDTTRQLLADKTKLAQMADGLREMQTGDANELIYETLLGLIQK